MKIVVISDTHKEFEKLKKIVSSNLDADLFVHLGDGEYEFHDVSNLYPDKQFVFVKGNCDFGNEKTEQVIDIGICRVFCTHGHTMDVHTGLDTLVANAKFNDCKIALYGHTHFYRTEIIDNIYVMNPGSVDSPRGHNKPSYGLINITPNGKITMNIVAFK